MTSMNELPPGEHAPRSIEGVSSWLFAGQLIYRRIRRLAVARDPATQS